MDELTPIALGVLRLRTHRQTRLFLRKDVYGRFMSCMVYLPRDRYTTAVRLRIQEILREALHGVSVEYSATVGESRAGPAARGGPGRAGHVPGRTWTPPRWRPAVAAAARGRGTRISPPRPPATLGEAPARALLDACSGRDPGDLQDRRARARPR